MKLWKSFAGILQFCKLNFAQVSYTWISTASKSILGLPYFSSQWEEVLFFFQL